MASALHAQGGLMLEYVASSTFGFWIFALAIVLVDSAMLLKAGEFTFRLGAGDRVELRLPAAPFLVRNHELVFALVSYFLRPFHLSSIHAPSKVVADKLHDLRPVHTVHRALGLFAGAGLLLIVVGGPAVSAAWGINAALFSVVPMLYANSIAAFACVFRHRHVLGTTKSDLSRLAFELLACPVLTVNVVKKLTMGRSLILNTWELAGTNPELRSRIDAALEFFDAPLTAR
jgi:hypothetical protein